MHFICNLNFKLSAFKYAFFSGVAKKWYIVFVLYHIESTVFKFGQQLIDDWRWNWLKFY